MSTCLPTSCFFASARADLAASLHRFAALCKVPLLVAILHLRSCDGWKPPVLFQVHPVHHAYITLARCFFAKPRQLDVVCHIVYQCCTVLNCARQGMRLYSAPSISTFSMTQSSGRTFSAILATISQYRLESAGSYCKPKGGCTMLDIGTVTLTLPLLTASGALVAQPTHLGSKLNPAHVQSGTKQHASQIHPTSCWTPSGCEWHPCR